MRKTLRAASYSLLLFSALAWASGVTPNPNERCPWGATSPVPKHRPDLAPVLAALRVKAKDLPAAPAVDNQAFQASYHQGSVEARLAELGYVDFKGTRIEVRFGERTYVLHSECPLLKRLNDEPFKNDKAGADIVVAMVNRAVESEFGPGSQLRRDLEADPANPDAAFERAAERAVKKIEAEFASVKGLNEYLKAYGIEPSQLVGIGWADRATGNGYGDVAAAFAARFTRRRAQGEKPYRSYHDTVRIIETNLVSLRSMNRALTQQSPKVFRHIDGVTCLDEGVYELLRKYPVPADLIRDGEGWDLRAARSPEFRELLTAMRTRFDPDLSAREVRFLAEYVNLVDGLSSPIFADKPKPLPWSEHGAALTGDLVGGGAENLGRLEMELLIASDRLGASGAAVRGSRQAEQFVTEQMAKKKTHFVDQVKAWVKDEARRAGGNAPEIETGHSADDMLAMIPTHLLNDPAALHRLAAGLNSNFKGRIRITLGPETFRDTGKPVGVDVKKQIGGGLESIHKKALLLAEKMGVPYAELKDALVLPKATVDHATGQVRIQLVINGLPAARHDVLVRAFAEVAGKEGGGGAVRSWKLDDKPILHP